MSYLVLDTDWETVLTGRAGTKRPAHRFLIVKVSMTNSGGEKIAIPLFTLIGADGTHYSEVTEGVEDVNELLTPIRELAPAQTEQGAVVFDAPLATYKLQLSDGGPIDSEKTALVELPLDFKQTPAIEN